jgi:hypothetical protein
VAKGFTDEDDALLEELGVEVEAQKETGRTARDERIIAGFEEIQRFVDQHGQTPQHGEGRDIFERLYALRLDRLRALPDCRAIIEPLDRQGLLGETPVPVAAVNDLDDDALLAELGIDTTGGSITELKHVRSAADKRAAEEIANRTKCEEFDQFKPLFERVKRELKSSVRQTQAVHTLDEIKLAEIQQGEFFVVGGQMAYVAELGEEIRTQYERKDSRLRVIYDNGTESDVLQRSFQRALYRDETARLITNPSPAPRSLSLPLS